MKKSNHLKQINIEQLKDIPEGGYLTIWRRIFKGPLWNEKRVFSRFEAWIDLIQMARWQEEPETRLIAGNFIRIQRGQMAASIRFLGERWNWDKNKVNRFIQNLEKEDALRRLEIGSGTVLELINYDFYNKVGQQQGQQVGQLNVGYSHIVGESRDNNGTASGKIKGQGRDKHEDKCNNTNNSNKEEELTNKPTGFNEAKASQYDLSFYKSLLEEEHKKTAHNQNLKAAIVYFIKQHKPGIADPYVDLWNIFANEKNFPKVISMNEDRKKKLLKRVMHKEFDFCEILKKAAQSEFLSTANWFSLDWIIKNDSNFRKVIEGHYDPKKEHGVTKKGNSLNDLIRKGGMKKRSMNDLEVEINLGIYPGIESHFPGVTRPYDIARLIIENNSQEVLDSYARNNKEEFNLK